MELENKKNLSLDRKNIIILSATALAVALLVIFASIATARLLSDRIYQGIHIGEIDVGGMSYEQAKAALLGAYRIDTTKEIKIKSGEIQTDISIELLNPNLDIDHTVQLALDTAKTGNFVERLQQINRIKKEKVLLPLGLQLDDALLEAKIAQIAAEVDIPEKELHIEIQGNTLVATKGVDGMRIHMENAKAMIQRALVKGEPEVELVLEVVHPKELTADVLYDEVCGDPVNASYKIENQKLIIIDEKIGVMFDKKEAESIIKESSGDQIRIPIITKTADVTASQVKASLFRDVLASYTTRYNEGDVPRSHNIKLATKSINGVILAPNDTFSYNDTVGKRTLERGYKMAHVYVGNQVEPGLGGGICQVSSTLFNAVVLSDLKVTTRVSHSMPVSYVPMGRDATVDYGTIDFKFVNSTNEPIRISATASGGVHTIKIFGIKQDPNLSVEMTTERLSVFPANVIQKEEPTLEEGTVKVEQKGSDGSVYNTYKVTKVGGSVVKSEFLTKSTYVMVNRVEIVGTKPKVEEEEEKIVPSPVPSALPRPSVAPAMTPVPPSATGTSSSKPTPSATATPSASPAQ